MHKSNDLLTIRSIKNASVQSCTTSSNNHNYFIYFLFTIIIIILTLIYCANKARPPVTHLHDSSRVGSCGDPMVYNCH